MNSDYFIDISADTCPITFVRTKLALEKMAVGQVLEVVGCGQEPKNNVPAAVMDHGHEILAVEDRPNDHFRLIIRVVR